MASSQKGGAGVFDNGDGTFDYGPDGQFESLLTGETATDTFIYTISDGEYGDNATVTITITGLMEEIYLPLAVL